MRSAKLKMVNSVEAKERCHVKISNRFAVFKNLDDDINIGKLLQRIRKLQPLKV
jgi:hypothetical protein